MAFTFADCLSLGEEVEVELIDENGIELLNGDMNKNGQELDKLVSSEVYSNDDSSDKFQKEQTVCTCHYCKTPINYFQDVNHKCFGAQSRLIVDNEELRMYQNVDRVEKSNDYGQESEFDRAKLLKLIQLVKMRPPLYDTALDLDERTSVKKAALWTEIQREFGGKISVSALNARWKRLKDRYFKNIKFLDKYSGKKKINWPLQSHLNFLEPVLRRKWLTEKRATVQKTLVTVKPMSSIVTTATRVALSNDSRTSLSTKSTDSSAIISKTSLTSPLTSTPIKTVTFPFTLCPVSCATTPFLTSVSVTKASTQLGSDSTTSSEVAINATSADPVNNVTCNKRRKNSLFDIDESWESMKGRLIKELSQEPGQPDPEEALGTYLTTVLRKLPNDKNQMLQVKVLKAISEVFLSSEMKDHSYV